MTGHPLDIPDFLKVDRSQTQDQRRKAWNAGMKALGRRITIQGSAFRGTPTRKEEAATKALRKEIAEAEAKKTAARFAALAELKNRNRPANPMETTMAKKAKQTVTTRFKKTSPKPATAMKKLRAERKPRGTTKPKAAPKPKADKTAKVAGAPKAESKTVQLENFLMSPVGVTLADVMEKFGLLAHSARAAITGVRKRREANGQSGILAEKKDGTTVYRIDGKTNSANATAAKNLDLGHLGAAP